MISEIQHRLLVLHECRVENRTLVTAVGRYDGKTAGQRGNADRRGYTEWRRDRSVEAATPLIKKSAVPIARQGERKADPIFGSPRPFSPIDHSLDQAMFGKRNSDRLGRIRVRANGS